MGGGQTGSSFIVACVILKTTTSFITTTDDAIIIMPFLLGALTATGAAACLAGVADVWYAVGTGQFQMISVDTAGIGFYFVLPVAVLVTRFFAKYGDFVEGKMNGIAGLVVSVSMMMALDSSGLHVLLDLKDVTTVYKTLVAFVTTVIVVGVPLVNSLCPISGYLFGRTYTHGQPNTKRVAVSVEFSELFPSTAAATATTTTSSESDRQEIFKTLAAWKTTMEDDSSKNKSLKAVLNINVTSFDLAEFPKDIQKLHMAGHEICIAMLPKGTPASIERAHQYYLKVLGCSPSWYHTGSSSSGSYPKCHTMASSLGMRSAMWSTSINATTKCVEALTAELDTHRGGSFIFLQCKDAGLFTALQCVLQILQDGNFVPTTLSLVAKEEHHMEL